MAERKKKKQKSNISQDARKKRDSGSPGGGAGRVEEVRGSGVYPASGPLPKSDAPYQPEPSWGQGARGAAGYEDSGDSEAMTVQGEPGRKMETREIPRDLWVTFLDAFSRQHQGWLVDLYVTADGLKSVLEAREVPLVGIAASLKHGDDDTISIILGRGQTEEVTHSISGSRRVLVEKTSAGADAGLWIEGREGVRTHLQFRSPALPETLDGVTSAEE